MNKTTKVNKYSLMPATQEVNDRHTVSLNSISLSKVCIELTTQNKISEKHKNSRVN